jgi:hypothetical protein
MNSKNIKIDNAYQPIKSSNSFANNNKNRANSNDKQRPHPKGGTGLVIPKTK